MTKRTIFLIAIAFALSFSGCRQQNINDQWITLFNGKDLKGWDIKIVGHPLNENFAHTFRVEDGLLKVSYDEYRDSFNERYGHIFYKEKFSSYLLVAEYRFYGHQIPGGAGWAYLNNGLMLHCQSPESMALNQDYPISIECQLLGSDSLVTRTNANVCTPGTNIEMNGELITQHCTNSDSKPSPAGQWTTVKALVLGDSLIQQFVGDKMVLEYTHPTIGGGAVHHYDPSIKTDGKPLKEGYIALQSESAPTEFKTVKLFNLEPYVHNPKKLKEILNRLLGDSRID